MFLFLSRVALAGAYSAMKINLRKSKLETNKTNDSLVDITLTMSSLPYVVRLFSAKNRRFI